MLDAKTITAIAKQVEHQFPEVVGCKPTVHVQHPPQAKNPSLTQIPNPLQYLVTFRGTAVSPEGISIPRLVRVVVNADGKIMKITTSR